MIQIYQKLYSIIFKSPELRKMALLHYTDTNINMSSIGTPETAFSNSILLSILYSSWYHDVPMAALPQIWTLYLLGLFLSIRDRCCLKASLFLFRAELYSTCSSSHGFQSSARNGAAPPSLTPPANTPRHSHSVYGQVFP